MQIGVVLHPAIVSLVASGVLHVGSRVLLTSASVVTDLYSKQQPLPWTVVVYNLRIATPLPHDNVDALQRLHWYPGTSVGYRPRLTGYDFPMPLVSDSAMDGLVTWDERAWCIPPAKIIPYNPDIPEDNLEAFLESIDPLNDFQENLRDAGADRSNIGAFAVSRRSQGLSLKALLRLVEYEQKITGNIEYVIPFPRKLLSYNSVPAAQRITDVGDIFRHRYLVPTIADVFVLQNLKNLRTRIGKGKAHGTLQATPMNTQNASDIYDGLDPEAAARIRNFAIREGIEASTLHSMTDVPLQPPLIGRLVDIGSVIYFGNPQSKQMYPYKFHFRIEDSSTKVDIVCWFFAAPRWRAALQKIGIGSIIAISNYNVKFYKNEPEISLNSKKPFGKIHYIPELEGLIKLFGRDRFPPLNLNIVLPCPSSSPSPTGCSTSSSDSMAFTETSYRIENTEDLSADGKLGSLFGYIQYIGPIERTVMSSSPGDNTTGMDRAPPGDTLDSIKQKHMSNLWNAEPGIRQHGDDYAMDQRRFPESVILSEATQAPVTINARHPVDALFESHSSNTATSQLMRTLEVLEGNNTPNDIPILTPSQIGDVCTAFQPDQYMLGSQLGPGVGETRFSPYRWIVVRVPYIEVPIQSGKESDEPESHSRGTDSSMTHSVKFRDFAVKLYLSSQWNATSESPDVDYKTQSIISQQENLLTAMKFTRFVHSTSDSSLIQHTHGTLHNVPRNPSSKLELLSEIDLSASDRDAGFRLREVSEQYKHKVTSAVGTSELNIDQLQHIPLRSDSVPLEQSLVVGNRIFISNLCVISSRPMHYSPSPLTTTATPTGEIPVLGQTFGAAAFASECYYFASTPRTTIVSEPVFSGSLSNFSPEASVFACIDSSDYTEGSDNLENPQAKNGLSDVRKEHESGHADGDADILTPAGNGDEHKSKLMLLIDAMKKVNTATKDDTDTLVILMSAERHLIANAKLQMRPLDHRFKTLFGSAEQQVSIRLVTNSILPKAAINHGRQDNGRNEDMFASNGLDSRSFIYGTNISDAEVATFGPLLWFWQQEQELLNSELSDARVLPMQFIFSMLPPIWRYRCLLLDVIDSDQAALELLVNDYNKKQLNLKEKMSSLATKLDSLVAMKKKIWNELLSLLSNKLDRGNSKKAFRLPLVLHSEVIDNFSGQSDNSPVDAKFESLLKDMYFAQVGQVHSFWKRALSAMRESNNPLESSPTLLSFFTSLPTLLSRGASNLTSSGNVYIPNFATFAAYQDSSISRPDTVIDYVLVFLRQPTLLSTFSSPHSPLISGVTIRANEILSLTRANNLFGRLVRSSMELKITLGTESSVVPNTWNEAVDQPSEYDVFNIAKDLKLLEARQQLRALLQCQFADLAHTPARPQWWALRHKSRIKQWASEIQAILQGFTAQIEDVLRVRKEESLLLEKQRLSLLSEIERLEQEFEIKVDFLQALDALNSEFKNLVKSQIESDSELTAESKGDLENARQAQVDSEPIPGDSENQRRKRKRRSSKSSLSDAGEKRVHREETNPALVTPSRTKAETPSISSVSDGRTPDSDRTVSGEGSDLARLIFTGAQKAISKVMHFVGAPDRSTTVKSSSSLNTPSSDKSAPTSSTRGESSIQSALLNRLHSAGKLFDEDQVLSASAAKSPINTPQLAQTSQAQKKKAPTRGELQAAKAVSMASKTLYSKGGSLASPSLHLSKEEKLQRKRKRDAEKQVQELLERIQSVQALEKLAEAAHSGADAILEHKVLQSIRIVTEYYLREEEEEVSVLLIHSPTTLLGVRSSELLCSVVPDLFLPEETQSIISSVPRSSMSSLHSIHGRKPTNKKVGPSKAPLNEPDKQVSLPTVENASELSPFELLSDSVLEIMNRLENDAQQPMNEESGSREETDFDSASSGSSTAARDTDSVDSFANYYKTPNISVSTKLDEAEQFETPSSLQAEEAMDVEELDDSIDSTWDTNSESSSQTEISPLDTVSEQMTASQSKSSIRAKLRSIQQRIEEVFSTPVSVLEGIEGWSISRVASILHESPIGAEDCTLLQCRSNAGFKSVIEYHGELYPSDPIGTITSDVIAPSIEVLLEWLARVRRAHRCASLPFLHNKDILKHLSSLHVPVVQSNARNDAIYVELHEYAWMQFLQKAMAALAIGDRKPLPTPFLVAHLVDQSVYNRLPEQEPLLQSISCILERYPDPTKKKSTQKGSMVHQHANLIVRTNPVGTPEPVKPLPLNFPPTLAELQTRAKESAQFRARHRPHSNVGIVPIPLLPSNLLLLSPPPPMSFHADPFAQLLRPFLPRDAPTSDSITDLWNWLTQGSRKFTVGLSILQRSLRVPEYISRYESTHSIASSNDSQVCSESPATEEDVFNAIERQYKVEQSKNITDGTSNNTQLMADAPVLRHATIRIEAIYSA